MKIAYRPEIDGLRAIAVLAVIIYHLKIDHVLPGGFLGVDVFFVISGFLISSIILKELSSTGSFSFTNFYKRRVRRLMPVFFVVLLSSMVAAWFILLPSQFSSFAKSGLASIFFLSNHFWFGTALEYEAQSSLLEPLLHTWTLAVEEQFYLVFPCLLVLSFTYFKKYLFSSLLLLTLASLLFAVTYTPAHEAFNFYLLPARLWELSAGALLAILNYKEINLHRDHTILRNLPSLLLLVLIGCFFYFDHETVHPGLLTTIPVLVTMGIISLANKNDLVTRILSSKPLVFVGLLSYSLYLWHFPIFAFARNLKFENSFIDFSIWVGLTFLLSFISYKLIEQPFRNKQTVGRRKFVLAMIPLLLTSIGSFLIVINKNGFPHRFNSLADSYFGNEIDKNKLREIRNDYYDKAISEMPFEQDKTNVLIIGDSHSKDLYLSFKTNNNSYNDYAFYRGGISEISYNSIPILLENDLVNRADIVIISYRFINKIWMLEKLEALIVNLKSLNKRVIIALNVAEFKDFGRDEVFDYYIKQNINKSVQIEMDSICRYFYENRRDYLHIVNDSILTFAQKLNIEYIDKYSIVCDDESKHCNGITPSGKKVYCDGSHLSLDGAKFFGRELRKRSCLIETNFVSNNFKAINTNAKYEIKQIKKNKQDRSQEITNLKAKMKQELNNGNFTAKEKRELKKEQKKLLLKKRKEIEDTRVKEF